MTEANPAQPAIADKPKAAPAVPTPPNPATPAPQGLTGNRYVAYLTLTALGVVFGDIGTSPLYAFRECFHGEHALAVSRANVLGVLSLIFWSMFIVITLTVVQFRFVERKVQY